jgi:copper chaperone CopZ
MANVSWRVGSIYCHDCVRALRSFIGKIKGVQSVDMVEEDRIIINYDPSELELDEERLKQLIIDSIDKLGFKVLEE